MRNPSDLDKLSATRLNLDLGFAFGELDKLITQSGAHYGPAMAALFALMKEAGWRAFVLERLLSEPNAAPDFDMTFEHIRRHEAAKLLLSMGYQWNGAWAKPE